MLISDKFTAESVRSAIKNELIVLTIDCLNTIKRVGKSDGLMLIDTITDNIYTIKALINNDNFISFGDVKNGIQEIVSATNTDNDNVSNV